MKVKPLENPATAEWGRTISHGVYTKLLKGFIPTDMDDKWMMITDTPDVHGNTVAHIYRSWSKIEFASLTIEAGDPNETETRDWATIVKISWDDQLSNIARTEEEAKARVSGWLKPEN